MCKNIFSRTGLKAALFLLLPCFTIQAFAQYDKVNQLEKQVQTAIRTAMSASVYITDYDPVAKAPVGSRFSGVVVTEQGTILTVGHTTVPGGSYQVTFPDGRACTATCLGRISGVDAAMLKINEQGKWPFAPMGWSSSLLENEPCIGISYPASYESNVMLVRFGSVAERSTTLRANRIRTTLLMEPGDSGGPAFDLLGRVIGMHSSIDSSLVNNFEVPIDLFRKYWHALQQPIAYEVLPMGEVVEEDTLSKSKFQFNNMLYFSKDFLRLGDKLNNSVYKLSSNLNGKDQVISATLVSLSGLVKVKNGAGKSFLLSKNSMVGKEPFIDLGEGKTIKAKIVARDDFKDLVLLEVPSPLKGAIVMNTSNNADLKNGDLGRFLISAEPDGKSIWSVVGTKTFDLPRLLRAGYSGAYPVVKDGKVIIGMVTNNSAAKAANINVGDQVISINGVMITDQAGFMKEMKKTLPGDELILVRNVSGKIDSVKIKMLKYPVFGDLHPAERFYGGKSAYRDGFDGIFMHDAKIIPSACGGPVFDINGAFLGINLARFSRTGTVVVGVKELNKFLSAVTF